MKYCTLLALLWLSCSINAETRYVPAPQDPTIPTPQQVLGFSVGDWHVRHDQIQRYFEKLAAASARAQLDVIGYSHEQRPLLQLVISSERNLARLDQIRQQHLAAARRGERQAADAPVIIWLGYSVHGNEPSGANAALLVAQYLASANNTEVNQWLDNAVILLQPALNPDGHDRFAIWANMHKGAAAVADPQHREHNEPWPNGRPNHYWFDLNRDWLLLQHPESRARIAQYQQWLPNVVGDYHEMGTNSSYFFQPGIPSRNYPLTPKRNFSLTSAIAKFHADAFDQAGQLYYTEESFDDFYIGKGSTYPDVQGSVGILFEQASSRGHLQDSINGPLSFSATIQNQLTASLSTIRGAVANRTELLDYQQEFYKSALQQAKSSKIKGYMLTEVADKTRLAALLDVLQRHHVEVYRLNSDWQDGEQAYSANSSYYVPLQQAQYRLVKAMFSTEKVFPDNTFYDVSAWTLPHAFNISFMPLRREPAASDLTSDWQNRPSPAPARTAGSYAYAFSWQDQQAPLLLQALLAEKLIMRSAMSAFTATTSHGEVNFAAGSMVLAAGLQQQPDWFARLQRIQQKFNIPIHSIRSGLTPAGSDLGSHNFAVVSLPKVLLIAGPGISSTEAGEAWYNLERLAGLSPSLAEPQQLKKLQLSHYSHIVLPDGNYGWQDAEVKQLQQWLEQGGVLWGHKRAAAWMAKAGLLQAGVWQGDEMSSLISTDNLSYQDKEVLAGKRRIAGAIYQAELDLSHPLTFGFTRATLPVFKNSTMLLQPSNVPFVNVALYSAAPQLAGYTAQEFIPRISQSAVLLAHNSGKGRVIAMTDNPVFRGYFTGSSRLLVNAMYLGSSFSAVAD
ncbi:M14 metallopeptidase family protein [Rheinheimera maricola]|uniref:M14 family metallopeptidase n=1 Tax=Rheinheimera maricola TaxID=2793282 RepID=A0ABS7XG36_9GAMM|nr:M14 metallopeptidase family protein [Rheinheimera maricola]MBZ9613692.1 M14 family metallopeptidase [Rheinheimera maricola]